MQQARQVLQEVDLMAIGRNSEQTAISKRRDERTQVLLKALISLAETRQTSASNATLHGYVAHLRSFDVRDVLAALLQLETEERGEFEPMFPQLGTVIARTKAARTERTKPPKWVCCGKCHELTGMVFVYRDADGRPCDAGAPGARSFARDCECKVEWRRLKALREAEDADS